MRLKALIIPFVLAAMTAPTLAAPSCPDGYAVKWNTAHTKLTCKEQQPDGSTNVQKYKEDKNGDWKLVKSVQQPSVNLGKVPEVSSTGGLAALLVVGALGMVVWERRRRRSDEIAKMNYA